MIKSVNKPVAEFIDPWLGDKVNSGIGLSYRPANHACSLGVPVRQPYAGVDFLPHLGIYYELGYWRGSLLNYKF